MQKRINNKKDYGKMENDKKKFIEDFEYELHMAEIKALSKHSLKTPLTHEQYERMMELKKLLGFDYK